MGLAPGRALWSMKAAVNWDILSTRAKRCFLRSSTINRRQMCNNSNHLLPRPSRTRRHRSSNSRGEISTIRSRGPQIGSSRKSQRRTPAWIKSRSRSKSVPMEKKRRPSNKRCCGYRTSKHLRLPLSATSLSRVRTRKLTLWAVKAAPARRSRTRLLKWNKSRST